MSNDQKSCNSPSNKESVASSLKDIATIGSKADIKFSPFSNYSLNLFTQLPPEVQGEILGGLDLYREILNSVEPDSFRLTYESELLRSALQKLNLIAPDDFVSTVQRHDICEIYLTESKIQIYRNLEFLKYCSYDPCLMLSKSWDELFERDQQVETELMERAEYVALNSNKCEPWGLNKHVITERLHEQRNQFEITLKNIAPVFNKDKSARVGWASTIRVKPLGSSFRKIDNVSPFK